MLFRFLTRLTFLILIICASTVLAEAQKIEGVVRTSDGEPIEKVWIRPGSRTRTDEQGKFTFEDASDKFLIILKEGFRPQIVKLKGETEIEIVLQKESPDERFSVAECTGKNKGKKVGSYLKLSIPKGFKTNRGKDIDYTNFFIFAKNDQNNHIAGWTGVNATSGYPKTEWIKAAEKTSVRSIYNEKRLIGYEYQGQTTDGKYWRYVQILEESIFYIVDSAEKKSFFDRIIDNSCSAAERMF